MGLVSGGEGSGGSHEMEEQLHEMAASLSSLKHQVQTEVGGLRAEVVKVHETLQLLLSQRLPIDVLRTRIGDVLQHPLEVVPQFGARLLPCRY